MSESHSDQTDSDDIKGNDKFKEIKSIEGVFFTFSNCHVQY